MIYLNENNIKKIGINWQKTIDIIEEAVICLHKEDFSQPIKPYLRYRNLKNRIIAMPAYIGGNFNIAGIKWIASFPDNIKKGIPRAHSVVLLNNANTGQPKGIINTALLSIIRTASVSGLMIRYFNKVRRLENINLGITGWGPIGQYHQKMCTELLGEKISKVFIYDICKIDNSTIDHSVKNEFIITKTWEEAYVDSDIFIACTVAEAPYINKPPKKRSLQLNVSLRDYRTDIYNYVKESIIVDNWEEVCRENTDIEMIFKEKGLKKEDTCSIVDVVINNCMNNYKPDSPIMFNPMGMAVFDIALAAYYVDSAKKYNIGSNLIPEDNNLARSG